MKNRASAVGFFWNEPVPEPRVNRGPPEPIWLHPGHLPGLEEAQRFPVRLLSDEDLIGLPFTAKFVFDIECYENYFLAAFKHVATGEVIYFEQKFKNVFSDMEKAKLKWMLNNFCIVTFNGNSFDLPMIALALSGMNCSQLKWACNEMIVNGTRAHDILRNKRVKKIECNHIDLIEVCPLDGSLKKYAARIHVKKIQDLPFAANTLLTEEQIDILRWYCIDGDLPATIYIHNELSEQLSLRELMSAEYGIDLRSKSDAQIAETVVGEELKKLNGIRPKVPVIEPGTVFKYKVPSIIKFESDLMKWTLDVVRNADYIVSESGKVFLPREVSEMKLKIGHSTYTMGNGGLHSTESSIAHITDGTFRLIDVDVESFYPRTILNQRLYPKHLGPNFLIVYEKIVNGRLEAKGKAKQCKAINDLISEGKWKSISDSLKITINGTFGKFGSVWSILFAPDFLIQVTITGQLLLMMLIERLELIGIPVLSGNTDGIVMRVPNERYEEFRDVVKQWEKDTAYITEETEYSMLLSRDVNNYMAIKKKGGEVKGKGVYTNPWSVPNNIWRFHKNPVNTICVEAIENLLTKQIPMESTIRNCTDIKKLLTIRDIKGGGCKIDENGKTVEYLGKMSRWYYAKGDKGQIVYTTTGNKVARSDGAKPMMVLSDSIPDDLDFDWYVREAESMLTDLGVKEDSKLRVREIVH